MLQNARIKDICLGAAMCAARYFTIWFMVGSFHKFFSGLTILGPLTGLYMTSGGLYTWFFIALTGSLVHNGPYSLLQLLSVYHIPTQAAAWYWKIHAEDASQKRTIYTLRVLFALLPLACMGAFMMHPVGWYAAAYTSYWIIPAAVAVLPYQNRWLGALGATFTAHALGSVLWIWTHPSMTVAAWLALIPVVAYERIILATVMCGCSYAIDIFCVKARTTLKAVLTHVTKGTFEVAL